MSRTRERAIAFTASAILLFFVCGTLWDITHRGTGAPAVFQHSNPVGSPGAVALWIFLIAGTDLPQLLRKSLYVRNQLLCLAAWQLLTAGLNEAELLGSGRLLGLSFAVAAGALGLFSIVALFYPPDVFADNQ